MSSSERFEDLKDDLSAIELKIKVQMKRNINEVTLNNLFSDGDKLVNMMRKEIENCPFMVRNEMQNKWQIVFKNWNSFKSSAQNNSVSLGIDNELRNTMSAGIGILERTGDSLTRAQQVARESEEIGTEVIGELSQQRESLMRTRERLDGTNDDLKKSHVILRSINRRVMTNKCLLIFIILLEIAILFIVIYIRFIRKKS